MITVRNRDPNSLSRHDTSGSKCGEQLAVTLSLLGYATNPGSSHPRVGSLRQADEIDLVDPAAGAFPRRIELTQSWYRISERRVGRIVEYAQQLPFDGLPQYVLPSRRFSMCEFPLEPNDIHQGPFDQAMFAHDDDSPRTAPIRQDDPPLRGHGDQATLPHRDDSLVDCSPTQIVTGHVPAGVISGMRAPRVGPRRA